MNDQVFTLSLFVFSILVSVIGFFCAFILTQILKKQSSTEEKLTIVLARLEGQAMSIEFLKEQVAQKCDLSACPLKGGAHDIPRTPAFGV